MSPPPQGKTKLLLPGRDMPWGYFFRTLADALVNDAVDDAAATVTFYCVVALFPFLLFVVGVVSRIVTWATIEQTVGDLARVAPQAVAAIVSERLAALKNHPSGGILTAGFFGTLWSASAGVASLTPALNRAYDVVETRPFWKRRLFAVVVTVGAGAVALIAGLIAVALPVAADWIGGLLGVALVWARLPFAALVMIVVWASLYTLLPNVRPRFQPITPGSVAGVGLWVIASWAFSVYVTHFGDYEATYGALGGVIVLLLWMWVSNMAFLLGAEINKILLPPEARA
ncbi:MAG: YihY/virulence factor BrkB family protein [Polyangiales bacterium]